MKPISRSSGRSSVAAAAYRAGERLTNERDGLTHDFTRRDGVAHAEIVLPQGSEAEWAKDRSRLWNAAELGEKRKDARVAREFEIALPHELSAEQRLALCRAFAQNLADRHGAAVDFAIHTPHERSRDQIRGDVRNHHAHLMMTTRVVTADGLGDKTSIERENKWLAAHAMANSHIQLREIRQSWEQAANEHLAQAGFEIRIDHRSHMERGLEIAPTEHMGVHATQMQRRGKEVSRTRLDAEAARRNAELIRQKPEQVLSIITGEKSVFDRRDVARTLHRYIDGADEFQATFATVMACPALVELQAERRDARGQATEAARYSTREMVEIERGMAALAEAMAASREHGAGRRHVEAALATRPFLSDEQRAAVRHVTGEAGLAAVVGLAGAGKSTMLSAAREAWEAEGYRVHGAALAGKAAEGLAESSGIASRTLASWEHSWQNGRGELCKGDVLVIDEAGMISSRQLARFVGEAERAGAKIVLVGDPEQLQPIQAGAAFRAVAERVGFIELEGVRRQAADWQRQASVDFARHRTAAGLAAYTERGAVRFAETRDDAVSAIVRDVVQDMRERPDGSRLVLAHRRADVRALNAAIREARQDAGALARGGEAGEVCFSTNDGERKFVAGDRVIFLENNRDLGVKNGMLGEVTGVSEGRLMARLDNAEGPGRGREVSVAMSDYAAIDHGYATTIHKSQGATVDRAYVLASERMDRHLTYVAMTRHRDDAVLYAGRDEFKGVRDLRERLSRSGAKETTLDYAERRGIAAGLGVSSQIDIPRAVQEPGRAPLSDGDHVRSPKEQDCDAGRKGSPAREQNGERPPGPPPERQDAVAVAGQAEGNSLAGRAPREAREKAIQRAASVLRRKPDLEIRHSDWLRSARPKEFPGEPAWRQRKEALRKAVVARIFEKDRLKAANEARQSALVHDATSHAAALKASAAAIAARVLERALDQVERIHAVAQLGVVKWRRDALHPKDSGLRGPDRNTIDAFERWLSQEAEGALTPAQREKLEAERQEAWERRHDDARPGLFKRAAQSLFRPAILKRLDAARRDLQALYDAVKPVERLVKDCNALMPAFVDLSFDEAVWAAQKRLDEETNRQQELWADRQRLPDDLAWLALQPEDVIVAARALNDAEDVAKRKADEEAKRQRLADEATAKLRERIDALRDGLRECVNGWRAAREANPEGFAENRREIEDLRLRLVDLKRQVEAALSDPGKIDRGEQALAMMHEIAAEARELLQPPRGYDWTPGGPGW